MSKVMLFLGNGFDLNLGLKTSYKHFMDSIKFEDKYIDLTDDEQSMEYEKFDFAGNFNIIKTDDDEIIIKVKENHLLYHFKTLVDKENWVDIEYELGNIAINNFQQVIKLERGNLNPYITVDKLLRNEYDELKQLLKIYLQHCETKFIKEIDSINTKQELNVVFDKYMSKDSFKLIYDLFFMRDVDNYFILNFNYTKTLQICFTLLKKYIQWNNYDFNKSKFDLIEKKIIYTHGYLENNNDIVFGINDKIKVDKEYIFLLKSYYHKTMTDWNIHPHLLIQNKIIFFGYSLGKTDESYFEDYFVEICKQNNLQKDRQRELIFYYYGNTGYDDIFYRLSELTDQNTSKLRQLNNIKYIEVTR